MTDSAYARVRDDYASVDAASSHNRWPADVEADLAALDSSDVLSFRHWVGFGPVGAPEIPASWRFDVLGAWDGDVNFERIDLSAGRLPAAVDEIAIDEWTRDVSGLGVGDVVRLSLAARDGAVEERRLEIVGVGSIPMLVIVDDSFRGGYVAVSDDFVQANQHLFQWSATGVDLSGDADRALATDVFGTLGWEVSFVADEEIDRVADALRPVVVGLLVLAVLAGFATLVVAVLALRRERELWTADDATLEAIGMPAVARWRIGLAIAGGVIGAAWIIGAAIAIPVSALGPMGGLARFDRDPPIIDWRVHVVVLAAVALAVLLAAGSTVRAERRPRSGPRRLTASGGVDYQLATWLLRDAMTGSRRRLAAALAVGGVAIAAVVAVVVFVESLGRLVDDPVLYGDSADVVARNAFGNQLPESVRALAADPSVAGVATLTSAPLVVEGVGIPAYAVDRIKGDVDVVVAEGRTVDAPDEIVLGVQTIGAFGVSIGDRIEIRSGAGQLADGRSHDVEVVGTAVFPSIGSPGVEYARLGLGAAISADLHRALVGDGQLPEWTLVDLVDGTDVAEWVAAHPDGIADASMSVRSDWMLERRPAEVAEGASIRGALLAGAIAIGSAVGLLLALAASAVVRRQRSQFAVLQALGLERHRRRRAVMIEVVAISATAIGIGAPVGLAVGRLAWVRFAEQLGVLPDAAGVGVPLVAMVAGTAVISIGGALLTLDDRSRAEAPEPVS